MARYWDQIRVSTSKTPDARCPQDATALAKVMPPLSNSRHDILESTSLAQHHQPYRPTNKQSPTNPMPCQTCDILCYGFLLVCLCGS